MLCVREGERASRERERERVWFCELRRWVRNRSQGGEGGFALRFRLQSLQGEKERQREKESACDSVLKRRTGSEKSELL